MPRVSVAKTVSAPKRLFIRLGAIVGALTAFLVLSGLFAPKIEIGDQVFTYERADTFELRQKGLSGRSALSPEHAMLFIHEDQGVHCYWMKGMQFNIDILWFDDQGSLVHFEDNVSKDSYISDSQAQTFCPSSSAKYIVEVAESVFDASSLDSSSRLTL